jgi:hypothetical protein
MTTWILGVHGVSQTGWPILPQNAYPFFLNIDFVPVPVIVPYKYNSFKIFNFNLPRWEANKTIYIDLGNIKSKRLET